jgi:hypothetical protein
MNRRGRLVSARQAARDEQTRQAIQAAPVVLVERDGRTYELRRLDASAGPAGPVAATPRLRRPTGGRSIA